MIIIIFVSLFSYGYLRWQSPRQLSWGAKDQDVDQLRLDDDIVEEPNIELQTLLGL
jgi:hypothetical protein